MERSGNAGDEDHLIREFVSLTAPVIGATAAEDLCAAVLDRLRIKQPRQYQKIGVIAAFLLGEFDDSMDLDDNDWEDIRETLEDSAADMSIDALTVLMGELLSRGKLG
jgi:hypothetical protein